MFAVSLFYLALLLIQLLLLMLKVLCLNQKFFSRLEIPDLLTNSFYFTSALIMSLVNVLKSEEMIYFPLTSDILASKSVFFSKSLTAGIVFFTPYIFISRRLVAAKLLTTGVLFPTSAIVVLRTAVVTKLLTIDILFSVS